MAGELIPGVFCFKDTCYMNKTTSGQLFLFEKVPALSIVKVSGWPDAAGGEGSCSWWGLQVPEDTPLD
jgi:hypothetical protein